MLFLPYNICFPKFKRTQCTAGLGCFPIDVPTFEFYISIVNKCKQFKETLCPVSTYACPGQQAHLYNILNSELVLNRRETT